MRGEFLGVWSETWREIWLPLIDQLLGDDNESVPEDIFCEPYRALAPALSPRPSVEALARSPASSSGTVSKQRGLLERLAFWRRER